jgi:hypothetical protein
MNLVEALRAIAGLPQHVLVRPTGIMIVMNDRQRILKLGRNGPHNWAPKFGDLVALDWMPMSPEQMKAMNEARAAAAAAAEGDQGGDPAHD